MGNQFAIKFVKFLSAIFLQIANATETPKFAVLSLNLHLGGGQMSYHLLKVRVGSHRPFPPFSYPSPFLVSGGFGKKPDARGGKSGTRQLRTTAQSGRRILIIEDDPSSRELYDFLLQHFGHATLLAVNGEEGLALARSTRPDLILCDIRLPKLGGMEVMKELKADGSLRHIPIIALTVFSSAGHRERLLDAGFDGYIPKPTEPETFIRQIESFLGKRKS
jgi:CheY-like chemotaxis protein